MGALSKVLDSLNTLQDTRSNMAVIRAIFGLVILCLVAASAGAGAAPQSSELVVAVNATTIESFPLENASEAFEKMMSGKVRFRAVLVNE